MSHLARVTVHMERDIPIASIEGEIDISNVAEIQDELAGSIPHPSTALVLDLSRTDYLDSAAVRLLFDLSRQLKSRGQSLAVVVPDGSSIGRILSLVEFDKAASVHSSVVEAVTNATRSAEPEAG